MRIAPLPPRRAGVALILSAALALAACGDTSGGATATPAAGAASSAAAPALAGVPTLVSPAQAQALLAGATPPVLLDVRTPAEFAAGHLAGATDLDLTGGEFAARAPGLDKSATYLVYCHSGNRSATATALMRQLGFTNVYELQGGISAWQAAGLPVGA